MGVAATERTAFPGSATPPNLFVTMTGHSPMVEGGGVATISTNAATCSMVFDEITPTPDDRTIIKLAGSILNDFAIPFRCALNTNHDDGGLIYFSKGGSASPAWNLPDTIEVRKYTGGVPTMLAPNGTPDTVPLDFPSKIGNIVSCQHYRLVDTTKIELMYINDQVLVRVNDIPFLHAEFTGGRDATGFSGIISYAGPSTTQAFDVYKNGPLIGRYVNLSTGSDAASGLDSAPWATMGKGIVDQAVGEVCFILDGQSTQQLLLYTSPGIGIPRTDATFEEPVMWCAKAGATVEVFAANPLLCPGATRHHFISLNIHYRMNGNGGNVIQFYENSAPHMIVGGSIKNGWGTGYSVSGDTFVGGNLLRMVLLHGNGRQGFHQHNTYVQTNNNIAEYCRADGSSSQGGAPCQGFGFHHYQATTPYTGTNTSGCITRYCVAHGHKAIPGATAGILHGNGDNTEIYGNRSYDNGMGIQVDYNGNNAKVYNNDVYENLTVGIRLGGVVGITGAKAYNNTLARNGTYGLLNEANSTTAKATNNIAFGNTTGQIVDAGSGLTKLTNFETDPLFVNASLDNHRLQATSTAAINGTNLGPTGTNEIPAIDRLGLPRPQGASWGHGAYELENPAEPPENVRNSSGTVMVDVEAIVALDVEGTGQPLLVEARGSFDQGLITDIDVSGGATSYT